MTPEERHLWYDFLKRLPLTVNRQKNIGNYVVDFFIARHRVVVEIDGRQHMLPEHRQADAARDEDLIALGCRVLRYTNEDIKCNFNSVCNDILSHLGLNATDLKNQ